MTEELDVELLMKCLEKEENDCLMDLDTAKVHKIKNDMLQKTTITKRELKKMNKQLKQYRFIDEIPDIKYGTCQMDTTH